MHGRTDCPADLPLPRLPTRQRERGCTTNVFCRRQIPKSIPTFHEVVGGSGRLLQRGFCGKCGSPISVHWPQVSQIQIVQVCSLDDPSGFQPATESMLSRAQPWHPVHPGTTKFEGRPLSGVKDKLDAYFAKRASSRGATS